MMISKESTIRKHQNMPSLILNNQFIFKKKSIISLDKDEMKKIIGGGNNYVNPSDHSGTPDCGAQTLNNTFS